MDPVPSAVLHWRHGGVFANRSSVEWILEWSDPRPAVQNLGKKRKAQTVRVPTRGAALLPNQTLTLDKMLAHPYRPLDLEIFGERSKDMAGAASARKASYHYITTNHTANMAPPSSKKRSHQDAAAKPKGSRPIKKQKKQQAYHSDSEEEDSLFKPVNLLDSDDEGGLDAVVGDDALSGSDDESQDSASEDENSARQKLKKSEPSTQKKLAQDAPPSSDNEDDDDDSDGYGEDEFDLDASDDEGQATGANRGRLNKRNDPAAFANSLQKILGTKLSTSRRSDPVLSRSADAHKASKEIVDAALEAKARKQMRAQKLAALERGRIKDVITGSRDNITGELETSTGEIREKEKQLRRAATRGVKEVFNAFLRAQQAGMEADSQARKDGFHGVENRKEKVTEMSRKGFLDLIATGGGKLKKGGIEEA